MKFTNLIFCLCIFLIANSPSYAMRDTTLLKEQIKEVLQGNQKYFKGYDCGQDCSNHQAGYNWADEHKLKSKFKCNQHSKAFTEGCYAWFEEKENAISQRFSK